MRNTFFVALALIGLCISAPQALAQQFDQLFRTFRADSLTTQDKRFLQTALAFEGTYNGLLDGAWGSRSQRALEDFAWREFGTNAEEWHTAFLAFRFYDIYDRDGWGMFNPTGFQISMLFPYKAVVFDAPSDNFSNWRHTTSSLAYSTGVHTRQTVQNVHDFVLSQHTSQSELYTLRRADFVVTSAIKRSGAVLYARSNYVNGLWYTVLLSAEQQDASTLNAVASSLSVGPTQEIAITPNGALASVVRQTLAAIAELETPSHPTPQVNAPRPNTMPPAVSSTGTGFIVSDEGHVITNSHVIENCQSVSFDGLSASIVADSTEHDLALLLVRDWSGEAVAEFSPTPARLNSDVTAVGYPLTGILSGLNVTRGAVSSARGLDGEISGMQITAPIQPGNSGGPLLASDGEVVGVVVAVLNEQFVQDAVGVPSQNVNFAIRGEIAKLFLFQNDVFPLIGTSDNFVPPEDIASQAAEYTGLIACLR